MEAQGEFQAGLPDPCLLLGGQPRSGTTLLTSILRCTPGHFQAFELHMRKPSFVVGLEGRYTRNIFKELGLPPAVYDELISQFDQSKMNLGAWTGPKEDVSAEQLTGRETDHFTEEMQTRGALVNALMRRVTNVHQRTSRGFKILGDIIHADVYARVWPNATFILMVRDPRDQAISILKLNEQRAARSQQNFYDDFQHAAKGWLHTITTAREVATRANLRMIEVRYEDLVLNTDRELARLSTATGLDLLQGLNFHEQEFVDKHTKRFKHHDNLRRAIHPESVGRWREELTKSDLATIHGVAGDLMATFHYK